MFCSTKLQRFLKIIICFSINMHCITIAFTGSHINVNIYFRLLGRRTIESTKFVVDPKEGHAAIALNLSQNFTPLGKKCSNNFCSDLFSIRRATNKTYKILSKISERPNVLYY